MSESDIGYVIAAVAINVVMWLVYRLGYWRGRDAGLAKADEIRRTVDADLAYRGRRQDEALAGLSPEWHRQMAKIYTDSFLYRTTRH